MKHLALLLLLFTSSALAEQNPGPVQVWCSKQIALCDPSTKICNWVANSHQTFSIELQKTGRPLSPKIWNGSSNVTVGNQRFQVSVFQLEENQSVDYVTVEFTIDSAKGTMVSGSGHKVAEVRFFDQANLKGFGILCSTDIEPAR
jgi:hypothetical protein